jgi:cytochrome c biogenesis protein CcdA
VDNNGQPSADFTVPEWQTLEVGQQLKGPTNWWTAVVVEPNRTLVENRRVIAIALLVLSLGLADSINPVTIAVAIYLASTPDPRRRLAGYTLGVFAVYLAGGLLLVVGPGILLRAGTNGANTRAFHLASIAIGVLVIMLAVAMWTTRHRWAHLELPERALRTESAFWLGAAMTAIDLPTAFPYFGAIGAIVGSEIALPGQVILLVAFNLLYVLPLLAILLASALLGERAEAFLARARNAVERVAPAVLTALTLAVGIALAIHGVKSL